ncbi:MAG: acyl-CoA dehydrogenase [Neomegalonema sp.]|nr:acyl-CoA dehydrogenase [Neomegalonema sp.]
MYQAPLADVLTTLTHMVGADALAQTDLYNEASPDTVEALIGEAGRVCSEVIAPLNRVSDLEGARLENGVVRLPSGFKGAYDQIAEGGWVGMSGSVEHGGLGMPITVMSAVNEMLSSACLSLSLVPILSQGAIEALEKHGTPEQQERYLPKLMSGEWNGTMNLTEPNAGSDVGALRTRAEPNGDGSYAITGGKIWITWGDSEAVSNVVHLVLARLPGAPEGTRGISLFLVPKYLLDANGEPGTPNALKVVSLDHKMGIHGSPTCVMAYEGATGWLIGEENKGMACMFTMMNNARLAVGLQGVGAAEAAYQHALSFAKERVQGRTPVGDGNGPIADHADVRRMLLSMKAQTQAARAIAYDCAYHLDLARAANTAEEREAASRMGAFLTPITKAFGTDTGIEVANLGIQTHGGMGFIEETGAAQYLRDVRITAIYEGTNGIQAMDLVGRKLSVDGGETARAYLSRIAQTAARLQAGAQTQAIGNALAAAVETARSATDWMLNAAGNDRNAGAVAYLRLLALVGGTHYLGRAALATGDPARIELARFWAETQLPNVPALLSQASNGASGLYQIPLEAL